jgi:hypothetical protein
MPTAALRRLPDLLVIGAQRSGTSSLYKYLGGHPDVIPSLRKETRYFSRHHELGQHWYRAHFPIRYRRGLCFEATPDYLLHPLVPVRVRTELPDVKLIVLLRDPVDRAFSHYRHMVRLGFEDRSFEEAIKLERDRIQPDLDALRRDPGHQARPLLRYSYVMRGLYGEQLERWLAYFDPERFLILRSENLFAEPERAYAMILEFLELPDWNPGVFANFSYRGTSVPRQQVSGSVREHLMEYFDEDRQLLARLLGRSLTWGMGTDPSHSHFG